jgi:SAM-dependent methyltransferase
VSFERERRRIQEAYARREARASYFGYEDASHVWRIQERQRAALALLAAAGRASFGGVDALDLGCGAGDTLLQLVQWGAEPARLAGIDLRPEAVAIARGRVLGADVRVGDATELPWPDGVFDLVQQHTVFTSILDDAMQEAVAAQMQRVLRPHGAILWYDFVRDNPFNRDVRGVAASRLRALFPGWRVRGRRVTLAPPLARRLPGRWLGVLYPALAALPALSTHLCAVLTRE